MPAFQQRACLFFATSTQTSIYFIHLFGYISINTHAYNLTDKMETGISAEFFGAHRDTIRSVQWNVDGTKIASGSSDNRLNVYDVGSGQGIRLMKTFKHFNKAIEEVKWYQKSPSTLVAVEYANAVHILDTRSNNGNSKVTTPHQNLYCALKADENYIAVSDNKDCVSIIDARKLRILKTNRFDYEINQIGWNIHNDADQFYMTTYQGSSKGGGTVEIMDSESNGNLKHIYSIRGHAGSCCCLDFARNGMKMAIGSFDSLVSIWDLNELICTQTIMDFQNKVYSVSFSHDSKYIACGTASKGPLPLFKVDSGEYIGQFECPSYSRSVSFNPTHLSVAFGYEGVDKRGYKCANLRISTVLKQ
jgi:THO complex subunit 3